MLKNKEMKELAKDLLLRSISIAYYQLEGDDYSDLSEEEIERINKYLNQYGNAMAKAIGKKYYTV